jgi:hypothetical protein
MQMDRDQLGSHGDFDKSKVYILNGQLFHQWMRRLFMAVAIQSPFDDSRYHVPFYQGFFMQSNKRQ